MKKDIAPEVLAFLKTLPLIACDKKQEGDITEADEVRIKIILSNATDPQAVADRNALKQYILNSSVKDNMKITDADREAMAAYLRKYAPEFYKLLLKPTS